MAVDSRAGCRRRQTWTKAKEQKNASTDALPIFVPPHKLRIAAVNSPPLHFSAFAVPPPPSLRQDPSTDPNRGPDAPLLDHSCHRLPTRYNGDLGLVMLNGGLGMVRTKNNMPEEWWRQRRARVVRFEFAGLRPWMWFASPFLPFVSTWESAHLR